MVTTRSQDKAIEEDISKKYMDHQEMSTSLKELIPRIEEVVKNKNKYYLGYFKKC